MTKEAESLTAQLRDVAYAFCLEVWAQALNAAGVDTESELHTPDKVYYPPGLLSGTHSPSASSEPQPYSLFFLKAKRPQSLSYLVQGKRDDKRTSTSRHCGGCGGRGGSDRGGTIKEDEEGQKAGEEGN